MQLTVRDAAKLLNVTEKTLYRWISSGELPAHRTHDQYHFNRAELLEWAASRRIDTTKRIAQPADLLTPEESSAEPMPRLAEALESGGIFHGVKGERKETALQSVVQLIRLPEEVDRDFLYQILLSREALGSTGIGEGIAIPHARNPIVLQVTRSAVSLCFLENPVDFGALDGRRVHTLFTLICPSVRAHLHLLSKLAMTLRDERFRQAVTRQASSQEILEEARRVEAALAETQGTSENEPQRH